MAERIALDTRGRLTIRDQQGNPVTIVIKLAARGFGNGRLVGNRQVQVCRYVAHLNDRKSPAQLARRARFSEAVAAWKALPPETRAQLHREALRTRRTGWNLWISRYMKTSSAVTGP